MVSRTQARAVVRNLLVLVLLVYVAHAGNNYRKSGDDHFFNLEYDQAIQDYTALTQQNSSDPIPYNDIAGAYLYKEMLRLGMLDSSAMGKINGFLHERPKPDPRAEAQFTEALDKGRQAAEALLRKDAHDTHALYALCTNYGLEGNYDFMLKRTWVQALRNADRAKEYCDQVVNLDPNFIDAYLLPGLVEYVAGSLPLPVRMLASIGGLHGSKKKGIAIVTRVAREGNYERDSARALLAVLYRREGRPLDAARVVEGLSKQYPRNYIFRVELASMYEEGGQCDRALYALRTLLEEDDSRISPTLREEVSRMEARLQSRSALDLRNVSDRVALLH